MLSKTVEHDCTHYLSETDHSDNEIMSKVKKMEKVFIPKMSVQKARFLKVIVSHLIVTQSSQSL